MATITGTQGEKVDQVSQLLLALQAQIRVLQWLGGIFVPLLIALVTWVVVNQLNNSTRVDIATLQGKMELLNQRLDQADKRMDRIEKTLEKIDAKLDKLDERLSKLEKQK